MKKWMYLLSVALLFAVLFGCGSNERVVTTSAQSKEYVYSFASLDEKLSDMELSQAYYAEDRLLLTSYRYEEVSMESSEEVAVAMEADVMGDAIEELFYEDMYHEDMYYQEYTQNIYFTVSQFDFTGEFISEFEVQLPSESEVCAVSGGEHGNVYMVLVEYGKDTSDPEIVKDLFSLIAYSEEGEELWRTTLGEHAEEDWYYVNRMAWSQAGLIVLASTCGIELYYQDGSFYKLIESDEALNGELYMLHEGKPALLVYGNRGMYMRTLDFETEELSEKIEFPFNAYEYSFYAGKSTDLLLANANGVYSYNFGEEGLKKRLDFVDSDMVSNNLYSLMEIQDNQFFGCFYDMELDKTRFGLFNKVEPSTIKDKKVITLACYWLDDDVRRRVVEYNKTNEEYRIRIEDYSQYNTSDDYTIGMTKMNTDIASGNTPDIVMISSDMPVESYISKGLFADLNPFLEQDSELKKEDYLENVIEAFSQNGHWYQMVPSFYLYTVLGKASEVGEEPGWTMEDLQALREIKGEEVAVFSEMTQNSILNYILLFAGNQFINWETGECHFESEEFIDLLEFANEFPKEIDYSELYEDQDYWEQQETMFRDGRALLMPYSIANFQDFQYCEDGTFGEQITAVGFPVNKGVGNVIMYNSNFAISAKSEYQQEAWEFLRYYLTEEYQDTIDYGWPIRKSSLDKKIEAAQQKPFYMDESGNKVEYEDTYYIGGIEIAMEPLSQEDCDRVVGFLNSAKDIYAYDQAIMSIVYEETASYFDGQKTAEEVADIIQSRIFIYVNENR